MWRVCICKSSLAMVLALAFGLATVSHVLATEKNKGRVVSKYEKSAVATKQKPVAAAVKRSGERQRVSKSSLVSGKKGVAAEVSRPYTDNRLAIQSGAALVVEQGGGGALYQKNADAVVPIASITKLMTAMVVLDGAPDLLADISISDEDVDYLRGSRSRLHVGAVLSRKSALLLALMSSENRAAHALARHYPGGMPAFLAAMNAKARSLGMHATHFDDPTGLSSSNVSTANDLARLVAAAHHYPLIREFSTTADATLEVAGRDQTFRNTNPLVKNTGWDVGLSKTGYIHEAGKCLVMQARVADRPVVIVLLDSVGKLTRVGDANRIKRWMENAHAARGLPAHAAALEKPATSRAS